MQTVPRFVCLIALSITPVLAQIQDTCTVNQAVPNLIRMNGAAELGSDLVMTCTGGLGASMEINVSIILNTNVTSKIMNVGSGANEALVLIDEPAPGVPDTSNGCSYPGQVLGTLGILACAAGSGNVYQGVVGPENNVITWTGLPFVEPGAGTRTLRFTNLRGNASLIGVPTQPISALVSITSDVSFTINQPGSGTNIAYMYPGLIFTATPADGGFVTDLVFTEGFSSAFRKRIENTSGGPLTAVLQDEPGMFYCTESGFSPQFVTTAPGDLGSADTGTRLLAEFTGLPATVLFLVVPNEVTSSSGALVAHRVLPPFTASFTGGTIVTATGDSLVAVSSSHTADLLYEVTANAPYSGVNGCATLTSFTIPVLPFFPAHLTSSMVSGRLAPVDGTATASPTAPRPRFIP